MKSIKLLEAHFLVEDAGMTGLWIDDCDTEIL